MTLLHRSICQMDCFVLLVVGPKGVGIVVFKGYSHVAWVGQHQVWLGAGDEHEEADIILPAAYEGWIFDIFLDD